MMTRGQLRFAASSAGILLGLFASCFCEEGLITLGWAMPCLGLAAWLLFAGSERREMRRRERRSL